MIADKLRARVHQFVVEKGIARRHVFALSPFGLEVVFQIVGPERGGGAVARLLEGIRDRRDHRVRHHLVHRVVVSTGIESGLGVRVV